MLKTLKLNNFRSLRSNSFDFSEGLQVVRGSNEAGKSTLLEAMLYALYGSRSLRNSLANTVTYGEKDATLRVEATFDFGGEEYKFVRHKGGAEVYVNGSPEPYVTGQNEVTAFSAQLVGADGPTATKLMMSSQGNLRGALEQGPKATAEMIEDLADFDLFDYLLDKMGTDLSLGSATHMEKTLEELRETLNNTLQVDYDLEIRENELRLKKEQTNEEKLTAGLEKFKANKTTLTSEIQKILSEETKLKEKKTLLETLQTKVTESAQELAQIEQILEQGSREDFITELERRLADHGVALQTMKVFKEFQELPSLDVEWEGTLEGLTKHVATLREKLADFGKQLNDYNWKKQTLESQLILEKSCPTCQQPIANADAHNSKIQQELADLKAQNDKVEEASRPLMDEVQELEHFIKQSEPFLPFAKRFAEYVEADLNFHPPRLVWKGGEVPSESIDSVSLQTELNETRTYQRKYEAARSKEGSIRTLLDQYQERVATLEQEIAATTVVPVDTLQTELNDLEESISTLTDTLKSSKETILHLNAKIQNLKNMKDFELKSREATEKQVQTLEQDIENLEFNNNLLKKVRLARPQVSDQLWNMTLAAVSSMFSNMRGVRSAVTKDKEGFKVNGEDIAGLSGSTLDILGASIRVALIRTFIPNCPFVVYDEPFAAMDEERTAAMLGFIQSTGFRQTLLVTHEDVSEQIADNLITL